VIGNAIPTIAPLTDWHDYFVAQASVSAALAGLLFVALSINIEHILKMAWLPPRAALTMLLLVGSLIQSLIVLIPHQALSATGIEESIATLLGWGATLYLAYAGSRVPKEFSKRTLVGNIIAQFASLPAVGGAIAIALGFEGGLFALVFSMLMGIVVAFLNSWVLLVEILR
jgi:modulator of FtsH protease